MSFYSFAEWLKSLPETTTEYWKGAAEGNRGELPYVTANIVRDYAAINAAGVLSILPTRHAQDVRENWRSDAGKRALREGGATEFAYRLGEFVGPAGAEALAAKTVSKIPRVARSADALVSRGVPLVAGAATGGAIQAGQHYAEGDSVSSVVANGLWGGAINLAGATFIPRVVGTVAPKLRFKKQTEDYLTRLAAQHDAAARVTATSVQGGRRIADSVLEQSPNYAPVSPIKRFVIGEMTEQAIPDW